VGTLQRLPDLAHRAVIRVLPHPVHQRLQRPAGLLGHRVDLLLLLVGEIQLHTPGAAGCPPSAGRSRRAGPRQGRRAGAGPAPSRCAGCRPFSTACALSRAAARAARSGGRLPGAGGGKSFCSVWPEVILDAGNLRLLALAEVENAVQDGYRQAHGSHRVQHAKPHKGIIARPGAWARDAVVEANPMRKASAAAAAAAGGNPRFMLSSPFRQARPRQSGAGPADNTATMIIQRGRGKQGASQGFFRDERERRPSRWPAGWHDGRREAPGRLAARAEPYCAGRGRATSGVGGAADQTDEDGSVG